MRIGFSSYIFAHNNPTQPSITQPPVLTNRFIINLKSLSSAGSSQGSSARHWSRFSLPNFCVPDSFLGNIGEDLQLDGHGRADDNLDDDQEVDAVSLSQQVSPEAEFVETSVTRGPSRPRPLGTQVSLQIHSRSKPCKRAPFHQAGSLGGPSGSGTRPVHLKVPLSKCVAEHIHELELPGQHQSSGTASSEPEADPSESYLPREPYPLSDEKNEYGRLNSILEVCFS